MIRKTLLQQKLVDVFKDPERLQKLMDKQISRDSRLDNNERSTTTDGNPYVSSSLQDARLSQMNSKSRVSKLNVNSQSTFGGGEKVELDNSNPHMFDLEELNSSIDSRKIGPNADEKFDLSIDITQENDFMKREDAAYKIKASSTATAGGVNRRTTLSKIARQDSLKKQERERASSLKKQRLSTLVQQDRKMSFSQASSSFNQVSSLIKRQSTLKRDRSSNASFTKLNRSIGEESDTESDINLPDAQQIIKPELKNNEFLKMYQMKNNIHEADREKANCIAQNLQYNKKIKKMHPFFNRKEKEEPDINLQAQDLFLMAQLTEQEFERLRGRREKDFRGMLHDERTMKVSPGKPPEGKKSLTEKKREAITRLKIYNQLLQLKIKKQEAWDQLNQSEGDGSRSVASNMFRRSSRNVTSMIQQLESGQRLMTNQSKLSRNPGFILNNTDLGYRPMTSFQLFKTENNQKQRSPLRIIASSPTQQSYESLGSPKKSSQNMIRAKTPITVSNKPLSKEEQARSQEKQLIKTSYSNIVEQVSQSNQLQLKKFHQQRIKEINKKFKGIQKYSIEDFVSFDKNFAEKKADSKDKGLQQRRPESSANQTLSDFNNTRSSFNFRPGSPKSSSNIQGAYHFKSKELIERENMAKNRVLQDRAIDKTIFFTKVSPNSFIKVYTSKFHLRENELLPFYRYEKNHEASLLKFKNKLIKKQRENMRKIQQNPHYLTQGKGSSKSQSQGKVPKSSKNPQPANISIVDNNLPISQLGAIQEKEDNDVLQRIELSSKESQSPGLPQSRNLMRNRFFTSHELRRPRTNTDIYSGSHVEERLKSPGRSPGRSPENDAVSIFSFAKNTQNADQMTVYTTNNTNKQSNNPNTRLFEEHVYFKDQILAQVNSLKQSVSAKKQRNLFSNFSKLIQDQRKLQKLVDDKIYNLDEAKANTQDHHHHPNSRSIKTAGANTRVHRPATQQKVKSEEQETEEAFEKYKQNFMKKVKVWNINELKKINSQVQKQFYQSIK